MEVIKAVLKDKIIWVGLAPIISRQQEIWISSKHKLQWKKIGQIHMGGMKHSSKALDPLDWECMMILKSMYFRIQQEGNN